jgi:hypothetical protein
LIVWLVLVVVALTSFVLRQRRQAPQRALVHEQSVIFATRAAILVHARKMEGNGWALSTVLVGHSLWCTPAASR